MSRLLGLSRTLSELIELHVAKTIYLKMISFWVMDRKWTIICYFKGCDDCLVTEK